MILRKFLGKSAWLYALLMLAGPWAQARPVDLSTPSNAFGPASD
jgi:hypothetical protein